MKEISASKSVYPRPPDVSRMITRSTGFEQALGGGSEAVVD